MRNLNRLASVTAFAAALALPLAAPATAGKKADDIVVSSKAAMKTWQKSTTQELNRMLARAPVARNSTPNDTIVQIAFTIDAEGKPDTIKILDGDANWAARQTALYAVKRLSGLADAPVSNPQGAKFLANLIFAEDAQTHRRLAKKLDDDVRERLAASEYEEQYILLGG